MKKETILTIVVCAFLLVIGVVGGYAFASSYRESDCGHCCDIRTYTTYSNVWNDCWATERATICSVRQLSVTTWLLAYENTNESDEGSSMPFIRDVSREELHIEVEKLDDASESVRLELHNIICCME